MDASDEVGKRTAQRHGDKLWFLSVTVIAAGIIFIGGRFLAAPSLAATGHGVPAGTESHSGRISLRRAFVTLRRARSPPFLAYGSAHPLGWFMLVATIIPVGDAAIVLHQGGSRATAFGIHGSTAAVMLIMSGLLLFS